MILEAPHCPRAKFTEHYRTEPRRSVANNREQTLRDRAKPYEPYGTSRTAA